jgi:hypothetical protein
MPQPGELLGGRYRLDDRIAAGGMGEVWRATDTVLDRAVAVKTLLAGYAGDAGFRTRFHHEARAMASLRHASVVPVYDFGDTGDGAYLVMARVDGQPLDRRIAERGSLSPTETMSVVSQAARALAAAHEAGIVHRDVKPGNLIIEPDGTVVLVDFGVARSAHSVTLTGAKEVVGTALYIAPEQVSKQTTGPSADVYALGAVAYHCLAGKPPFLGDNPLAVALQHMSENPPPLPASVPEPVRDLIATAMEKDPAARFPSAAAMADTAGDLLTADSPTVWAEPATTEPATTEPAADSQATAIGQGSGDQVSGGHVPGGPRPDGRSSSAPGDDNAGGVRYARGLAGAGIAPLATPRPPAVARAPLAATAVADYSGALPNTAANSAAAATSIGGAAGAGGTATAAVPSTSAGATNSNDTVVAPGLAAALPRSGPALTPPGSGTPGSPAAPNKRRNLALLSVLLIALIGTGTLIAVADPFNFFPGKAPATTAPENEPANPVPNKNDDKKDDNPDQGSDNNGDNGNGNGNRKPATSPTPRDQQETTAPANPATTDPETADPTTPGDDTTTEPETTQPETTQPATPTTQPEEDDDNSGSGSGNSGSGNSGSGSGNSGSGNDEEVAQEIANAQ